MRDVISVVVVDIVVVVVVVVVVVDKVESWVKVVVVSMKKDGMRTRGFGLTMYQLDLT